VAQGGARAYPGFPPKAEEKTLSGDFSTSILTALEIVVLRRTGNTEYEIYGEPPKFYSDFFPASDAACPWKHSEALRLFLPEAENFFSLGRQGTVSSGIWREEGQATRGEALIAHALCLGEEKFLLIRLLGPEFASRARMLQTSRDNLLLRRFWSDPEQKSRDQSVDALTGLPGREDFLRLLKMLMQSSSSGEFSLLMLDIDDFGSFNALYGLAACDAALAALGGFLRQFLRNADTAARYRDVTFAVVAPTTGQFQSLRMAEKLRRNISEQSFGELPPLTVSVGCSTRRKEDEPEDLITRADLALHDAKKSGKNTVRMR
jgi:diguanylate cyclase (GGDEF)-like protein